MNRRTVLSAITAVLPLAVLSGCGLAGPAATPLDMAKTYADALADAVSAASLTYLSGPPMPSAANAKMVQLVVADLQTARHALDSTTAATDARPIALQVIAGVQQLVPLLGVFLGPAAPYVPLAIAVIQAFINSLPVPPNAPTVPPAALQRQAAKYHAH